MELYKARHALIVGVSRYQDQSYDLSYARRDAEAVAETLRRDFGFARVLELYDEEATRGRIVGMLENELQRTDPDDAVLIFFAGHCQTVTSRLGDEHGFLVPHDGADARRRPFENVALTAIRDVFLPMIGARHVLLVLDACYGGLALRDIRADPDTPVEADAAHLRDLTRHPARQVLAAGKRDQQALDGGLFGHSIFTGRFLEALGETRRYLPADELFALVRRRVSCDAEDRRHRQTPQFGHLFGSEGMFVFERTTATSAVPPGPGTAGAAPAAGAPEAPPAPAAPTPVAVIDRSTPPMTRGTLRGAGPTRLLVVTGDAIVIGRSREKADIVAWLMPRSGDHDHASRQISQRHVRLHLRAGEIGLRHLSSVNRTFLDGAVVERRAAVPLGQPSKVTLIPALVLRLTPLPASALPDPVRAGWQDHLDLAADGMWSWTDRTGIGGVLIERGDGLAEVERYLWLISRVALGPGPVPAETDDAAVTLFALPQVAIAPALGRAAIEVSGESVTDETAIELMEGDEVTIDGDGASLRVGAFEQDLTSEEGAPS